MANDPVQDAVDSAKKALGEASKFTNNVTGNATNAFAPKKDNPPKPPQARRVQDAPYSLKRELDAKADNISQYVNSQKQ